MHTMNSMDVNKSMDDRKKRRLIAGVLFTVYFAVLFYFLFFQKKWDGLTVREHIIIILYH